MAAFGLPKASEEEKKARSAAIQAATREAALVPYRLAEAACAETKGVDLYTAETLAAYGRERAKILPEDLHYS